LKTITFLFSWHHFGMRRAALDALPFKLAQPTQVFGSRLEQTTSISVFDGHSAALGGAG
jgi:hypothetical protein